MDKITVKYGLLKKTFENLKKINPTDDTEISFEYVVGSCFPNIYKNIQTALRTQYTKGYAEGSRKNKEKE